MNCNRFDFSFRSRRELPRLPWFEPKVYQPVKTSSAASFILPSSSGRSVRTSPRRSTMMWIVTILPKGTALVHQDIRTKLQILHGDIGTDRKLPPLGSWLRDDGWQVLNLVHDWFCRMWSKSKTELRLDALQYQHIRQGTHNCRQISSKELNTYFCLVGKVKLLLLLEQRSLANWFMASARARLNTHTTSPHPDAIPSIVYFFETYLMSPCAGCSAAQPCNLCTFLGLAK